MALEGISVVVVPNGFVGDMRAVRPKRPPKEIDE